MTMVPPRSSLSSQPIKSKMGDSSPKQMLILASGSPRRRDLLAAAGFSFSVISPEVEELGSEVLAAVDLCLANARLKAAVVAKNHLDAIVLASDTVVTLDGVNFGKPADLNEARENLRLFRGKTHQVMTGVVLQRGEEIEEFVETSEVTFRPYSDEVIEEYLKIVPVLDKAGGYAIQDHGEMLVEKLEGDFDNIVGLPLTKVLANLSKMGFDVPQTDA